MSTGDAALLVAVIAFFLVAWIWVRQNDLERRISDLDRSTTAKTKAELQMATVTILHHRGEGQKGYFLLQNIGGAPATDVTLNIRTEGNAAPDELIPGDNAGWPSIGPGKRVTLETITVAGTQWPIEVLVTWNDPQGPHANVINLNR